MSQEWSTSWLVFYFNNLIFFGQQHFHFIIAVMKVLLLLRGEEYPGKTSTE